MHEQEKTAAQEPLPSFSSSEGDPISFQYQEVQALKKNLRRSIILPSPSGSNKRRIVDVPVKSKKGKGQRELRELLKDSQSIEPKSEDKGTPGPSVNPTPTPVAT
ncbi:hypothetical protein FRB94_001813 [Tulasnella sp. JGI-2019a]|nr:hypothetical protein FRB94_001813 [Tulasnella sp. JGI-2019a]